jgi:glycine dehydrogenase subunit 2
VRHRKTHPGRNFKAEKEYGGLHMKNPYNKTIFELSGPCKRATTLPACDVDDVPLEHLLLEKHLRKTPAALPELSQLEVVRHFTNISTKNYSIDKGFYPLGSCTMKYNPKINEDMAGLDGFKNLHPYQDPSTVQGGLQIMYELSHMLCNITGMDHFSLQPAAGAHGELAGLMIMKEYHEHRKDFKRKNIIVPDSAHGTNPASAKVAGFHVIEIASSSDGKVDLEALKRVLNEETAGLMLTNPNTLGLFETDIVEIAKCVHAAGGLLYYDGANMNAIMGRSRPGDMGFDVVHLNLHKTFSTPHGGGGPGCGPVGVKEELGKFLPVPIVTRNKEDYALDWNRPDSIGKIKNFYGNFGMMVRAYTYILTMGAEGLKEASSIAVLNANYLKEILKERYLLPIDSVCKHEFILSGIKDTKEVSTLDVAKRIIDYGFHPPTIYFPLVVENAMMIEPTETESKETLDAFAKALNEIAKEAKENPQILKSAPHDAPVRRLDEAKAARVPTLTWKDYQKNHLGMSENEG